MDRRKFRHHLQLIVVTLLCFGASTRAQTAAPGTVQTPEIQVSQWLATLEARFASDYEKRVVQPFRKSAEEVWTVYRESLKAGLDDVLRLGNKQDAAVFQEELKKLDENPGLLEGNDADFSSEYIRVARRQVRQGLLAVEQKRDATVRQLLTEFDAALVQAARQLVGRQLMDDAAWVRERRRDIARVWLPNIQKLYPDIHIRSGGSDAEHRSVSGSTSGLDRVQFTKKDVEESVKWLLEVNGSLTVRYSGKTTAVHTPRELPAGRADFVEVCLDGNQMGRPLIPGEMQKLAPLQGVESLKILNLNVPDPDLAFLERWRQLRNVCWQGGKVSNRLAQYLSNNAYLQSLDLEGSSGVTAEFFRELAVGVQSLRRLYLGNCPLDSTVLDGIERHRKLEVLVLEKTPLTPECPPQIAGLAGLKELALPETAWTPDNPVGFAVLSRLKLERFSSLNPASADFEQRLKLLKNTFPQLKSLRLVGENLTIDQAEMVRRHMRSLVHLYLSVLPAPGAAAVLEKMPKLDFLECRHGKLTDDLAIELLGMRNLTALDMAHTHISDACSDAIQRAADNGLKAFNAAHTPLTPKTALELKRKLPNFHLIHQSLDPH